MSPGLRALAWATLWARFAERARLHLASLNHRDPEQWLGILRWQSRWVSALQRCAEALDRADPPRCFVLDREHPISIAFTSARESTQNLETV